MSRIKLLTLIAKKRWAEVQERITSSPNETRSWENGYLPIHRACWHANAVPIEVIKALIESHPESLKQKTHLSGELPLHIAVRLLFSANSDVVKVLLQHFKEGASVRDYCGRTPLTSHLFSCPSPLLGVTKMLVEAQPETLRMSDRHKWYPLHFAAYRGDWEISEYLIGMYPDALLQEDDEKRTPRGLTVRYRKHQLRDRLHEEEEHLILSGMAQTLRHLSLHATMDKETETICCE